MNKSFTAAIAIAATAGLAFAAIETDPAGYIERNTQGAWVCNPFSSFTNGVATTLADVDGSNLGNGDSIAIVSPDGTMTEYVWSNGGWATTNNVSANPSLPRGDAIVLKAVGSNKSLVISGPLTNADVGEKSVTEIGYKLVGNASAGTKHLSDFGVGGNYNPNYDYVQLNGTKYIYNNGWKVRATGVAPSPDPEVASGEALFLYCGSTRARKKNGFEVTITVPDDAE
jgi:hypothetical protein